jgi:hypothetical protein
MALLSTTLALIATSRSPEPCAVEEVTLRIESTCGAPGEVVVASDRACIARVVRGATEAGLPPMGTLFGIRANDGVMDGFSLSVMPDGGALRLCTALPSDGGLSLSCEPLCAEEPDAGPCSSACSGTLTP